MTTGFEKNNNTTATYHEAIEFFNKLSQNYENIKVSPVGMTDIGYPLHEVVISKNQLFDPAEAITNNQAVLFINNAIHPGEPCGVDASMMLARDLLTGANGLSLPNHVVIVIIPIYNIGGALNRNSTTRANQIGPESYGFRGNAQNLDLNRDFIKCDSKNAKTFNSIFNKWSPHILVDNHTSNGADYQYTMTLITTQKDKLQPILSEYTTASLLPTLYSDMEKEGYEMIPYVYAKTVPDDGIKGFLDLPRYSSGYAALHHTISFMPETHMLKPYKDRVLSTYALMKSMINKMEKDHSQIIEHKKKAISQTMTQDSFDIAWVRDDERVDELKFKGYTAKYKKSKVTGQDRLYYDQSQPYEKTIPFYNSYKPSLQVATPTSYIIPQAYSRMIDIMELNGVEIQRLKEDKMHDVQLYQIIDYKTMDTPYEGHYLHYETQVESFQENRKYFKGDYIINVKQAKARYIVECLEPQSADSYFAWNFFDGILMRKEYFSPYVFEELAEEILESSPTLKASFEERKKEDKKFGKNAQSQLEYIYHNSKYAEKEFSVYPIGRVNVN